MMMSQRQGLAPYGLIGLSIAAGVIGQTTMKLGVNHAGLGEGGTGLVGVLGIIFTEPLVLFGLACYVLAALAWIAALTKLDLSVAYPFLALNFVLVALSASMILGEAIPPMRWVGIGVICAGILLVARSARA
jgi:multidrug transporter EmrE-like cation transporter